MKNGCGTKPKLWLLGSGRQLKSARRGRCGPLTVPGGLPDQDADRVWELTANYGPAPCYMFVRNESESFRFQPRFHSASPIDRQGRPNEPQLVYRRDPQTGKPVVGALRLGAIPHFCEKRPDLAPIRARAETLAEKEWFNDQILL